MTDLDRYGLFALAVVILLILFISLGEMDADDGSSDYTDCPLNGGIPSGDVLVGGRDPEREGTSGSDAGNPSRGKDFDFAEPPVPYRGSPPAVAEPKTKTEIPAGGFLQYKVCKGDSLSSLSKRYYGSISYWRRIARANGDLSPRNLKVGSTVLIPLTDASEGAGPAKRTAAAREHVVKKNDTLSRIARQYYGTTKKWRTIYDANRDRISNPDRLEVGVALVVPR